MTALEDDLRKRAKAIAAEANECCNRSDGYEEAIEDLALQHLAAVAQPLMGVERAALPPLRAREEIARLVCNSHCWAFTQANRGFCTDCQTSADAILSSTAGQEWESTERHIDEILRIATQDMTAAFGDSAEQYRREAIKAVLAAENWAGVCYERRRTAGQEWRDISSAAEAFRITVIESGALNHVRQDTYFNQLRALETALAALPAPPDAEPKETP